MLPPFSVAYIKGWRRSVSALIVAEAVRELGIEAELRSDYKAWLACHCSSVNLDLGNWHLSFTVSFQATMRSVFATVARYDHVQQQVLASRGGFGLSFI